MSTTVRNAVSTTTSSALRYATVKQKYDMGTIDMWRDEPLKTGWYYLKFPDNTVVFKQIKVKTARHTIVKDGQNIDIVDKRGTVETSHHGLQIVLLITGLKLAKPNYTTSSTSTTSTSSTTSLFKETDFDADGVLIENY